MTEPRQDITPIWPDGLAGIDFARVRFALEFESPCQVQPSDFLGLSRILRQSGRHLLAAGNEVDSAQWEALFQPSVSTDPVARRRHQKPASAYVMTMPVREETSLDAGDQLACEVLFLGTGIPLIHVFLYSLSHLGRLGLVAGEGRFEVTEVVALSGDGAESKVWSHGQNISPLACPVIPATWLLMDESPGPVMTLNFITPARLIVDGRPLRKPRFNQIFPFMLRRVTSMFNAHCGFEASPDLPRLVELAAQVEEVSTDLNWCDWRTIDRSGLSIGGFVGSLTLAGAALDELYWVMSAASYFGVGKAAGYGAGQIELRT